MTTMTQKTTRVTEAQAKLIEQFREHTNIDALVKALATQSQELEDAAWQVLEDTQLDTAVGTQLDNLGTLLNVEREGKSDADYRVRLQAQVLRNQSSGTIEELLQLAVALGSATDNVLIESYPAKIEIEVGTALVNGEEIGTVVGEAKAAGVGYWFTWFESSTPFTFDTAGLGFDQGELGDSLTA